MRILSLDTETFRFGPQNLAPKLVCLSGAEIIDGEVRTFLLGNGEDVEGFLRGLLEDPEVFLVFHNAGYDLAVIVESYPALEPLVWKALADDRVTDTLVREKLLNLSTSGKLDSARLPDGSSIKISYKLADLVLKYLGEDRSSLKEGDDIWRLRYSELDGLRADQYPRDAAEYAKGDASDTLRVFYAQEASCDELGGSMETQEFQTRSAFALYLISCEGMAIDPERFAEVQAMLDEELSEEKMAPLIETGIITRAVPALPYSKQTKKALDLVGAWLGRDPTERELVEFQTELEACGVKFKKPEKSSVSQAALKSRVAAILLSNVTGTEPNFKMPLEETIKKLEQAGFKYKKTDGGDLCCDDEVIKDVATHDPVMAVYEARQTLQKLVSTELPRMTWEGKPAAVVHFPFDVLKETGRTSSYSAKPKKKAVAAPYPSANGQNIDPRVRPAYVPRPGYVLCSTDYSTLELVTTAQVTYNLFGKSVHRDKINAGYDLHAYLGSQMALRFDPWFRRESKDVKDDPDYIYELFHGLKKEPDRKEFYGHYRKFAKPIGLGFPGGLGPNTVINTAKKTYDVDIIAIAKERFKEAPQEFDLTDGTVRYWAQKLYGWDKDEIRWTPRLLGVSMAKRLKELWLDTYPEMVDYFDRLNSQRPRKSWGDDDDTPEEFTYTTPLGMVRAGCNYTSAANGECMQSPAAEGFKTAVFNLKREIRDVTMKSPLLRPAARFVNEIHDETLVELWEPDAHDLAQEVARVMRDSMGAVITDVKVKAQPCLMRRWHKEAEPVFDANGRLIPWEPKTKK